MQLLTTTQLAAMLDVSAETARRICKRDGFQVGHLWGIDAETAEDIKRRRDRRAARRAEQARQAKPRRRSLRTRQNEYMDKRRALLAAYRERMSR